ncbi:MAG: CidA/LrgA family protein [Colwellia sp.]
MKNVFYSFFVISLCLLLGKGFYALVSVLPASLYGMLLYCLFLKLALVNEKKLVKTNTWLIKNMGICFVPAGVGIMTHFSLLQSYGLSFLVIIFITTFLLLTIVGLLADRFIKHGSYDKACLK